MVYFFVLVPVPLSSGTFFMPCIHPGMGGKYLSQLCNCIKNALWVGYSTALVPGMYGASYRMGTGIYGGSMEHPRSIYGGEQKEGTGNAGGERGKSRWKVGGNMDPTWT